MSEAARQSGFVGSHVAGHEDVAGEAQAEADEGNVFDAVFEDDVDGAVAAGEGAVSCAPEVGPVVIEL